MATGWTQLADSKGEENELGDRDDLDGLSQEQLLATRLHGSEKGSEANGQATAWAEQWDSKLAKREEVQWPQDM